MGKKVRILLVFINLLLIFSSSQKVHLKIPLGEVTSEKWEKLAAHLIKLMSNNDEAQKLSVLKVDVSFLVFPQDKHELDGFQEALMKKGSGKITILSHAYPHFGNPRQADYVIILIDSNRHPMNAINYLPHTFPNENMKFLIIVNGTKDLRKLFPMWNALMQMDYINVYMIGYDSGDFNIYNTQAISQQEISIGEYEGQKYITLKDAKEPSKTPPITAIYHEMFKPSGGRIVGPDERMIKEFSAKMKIPYQLLSVSTSRLDFRRTIKAMFHGADLCLSTTTNIVHEIFDNVIINEENGLCLLVPRNILVYSLPLDKASIIMALLSIMSVIIFWKMISSLAHNPRSMSSILFAVYELTFNFGASRLERLTTPENIMIYCYIFGTFILVSFYESIFLSLMLIEPTWRSAETLQELNESDTIFNAYLDPHIASRSNIPAIRPALIQNIITDTSTFALTAPEHPDPNLVYFVLCKQANTFMKSSRNFIGSRQLFDKMILTSQAPTYTVRKAFHYAEEFMDMTRSIVESGIYNFWRKEANEQLTEGFNVARDVKVEEKVYIDAEGMYVPIAILLFGCFVSFIVFIMELAVYRWNESKVKKVEMVRNDVAAAAPRKKIKLDKWLKKYVYTKTIQLSKLKGGKEYEKKRKNQIIKAREVKNGDYFKFKKFDRNKKVQRRKPKSQIIQVRPCNEIQETEL